ncbi:trafficking PGA2 [Apiospora sp. TS-2023a]
MAELQELIAHLGDSVQKLFGVFGIAGQRMVNNTKASFDGMDTVMWLRVVVIVCGYLLLRPYLMQLGAKAQEKQFGKGIEESDEHGKISPNELRGVKEEIPDGSDDEEATSAQASATEWGKKARKRQRTMLKKMIDAEEKRLQDLQDDEEDKDIEQYLVG